MPTQRVAEEYPLKSGILIAHKTNPTGSRAYRVDIAGSITGSTREQRQFPTKAEARRYAKHRHDELLKHGHSAFALTTTQRGDALRALALLESCRLSLTDAARIAASQCHTSSEQLSVTQLYSRFMLAPGRRKARAIPRRPLTVVNLTWRLNRFERAFGTHMASEISTNEVRQWLSSLGELSAISFNNYRRVLHAMFSFGVSEGYLACNPITKIPLYVVPHKAPPILTVDEAEKLLNAAWESEERLGLLGFVALGLFAGVRRAELEQLDWSAVKWERKMVTVDGTIAKSGSIRNVTLPGNALAWLGQLTTKAGQVCPRNMKIRLRELWKLAGFKKPGRNELRHSFASYHYDLHQNGPLTAAQLGHSTGTHLLFEHYRSLVPLGDGERFFNLLPRTSPELAEKCQQVSSTTATA